MDNELQTLINILLKERDVYRQALLEIADRGDAWSAQKATEAVKKYISNEEGK
jgi:hypothetical protein